MDKNKQKRPRARPTLYGEKMVQVALWMTKEQREKLQRIASENETTSSAVIRQIIDTLAGE